VVDIPESEALLFPTHFSRIPASAAALSEKPVVSCETFTCIYGFTGPRHLEALKYWKRENVADLKLLADAVFANGVNRIVWQGMPFNAPGGPQEFFASVHVGPGCSYEEAFLNEQHEIEPQPRLDAERQLAEAPPEIDFGDVRGQPRFAIGRLLAE